MILLVLALILVAYFGIGYVVWRVTHGRAGFTRLAILLAVMVGVPYLAWTIFYPSSVLRAKLTVEIETPEGLRLGSSVQQLMYKLEPCPLCNHSGPVLRRSVKGEAVVVDLGSRGVLFALLRGDSSPDPNTPHIVMTALAKLNRNEEWATAEAVRRLRSVSGKAEIPADLMFLLVRFRDLNDPKTVERVDPANLAASFGPGVKLINAMVEIVPSGLWPLNVFGITGTPLTTGIETRLVWLPKFYDKLLDGDTVHRAGAENRLANSLGSGYFKSTR